jgi:hypothetical protein
MLHKKEYFQTVALFVALFCTKNIDALTYLRLTNNEIKNGYETKDLGEHLLVSNSLDLKTTSNVQSNITVNDITYNNVLISITKNDANLDLNMQSIIANKSGHIAIAIADNVSGVTIKNGTIETGISTFNTAIIVGKNCSNIKLENIIIKSSSDQNSAAINLIGNTLYPIKNISLKNITVFNISTTGIKSSYAHNLVLENIICNNINSLDTLSVIECTNCKYINCKNIKLTSNTGSGETISMKIQNCKDGIFQNILSSSNDDKLVGAYTKNITVSESHNLKFENIEITNTKNAHSALSIESSKNIDLHNALICNNESGASAAFMALYFSNTDSLVCKNCEISNCIGQTTFNGITTALSGASTNFNFENIKIIGNQAVNGDNIGINLTAIELINLENISIAQNQTNSSFYGLKTNNNVKNISCKHSSFTHNISTTTNQNNLVAGIYVQGSIGLRLNNCTSSYNNGSSQSIGFFISRTNAAEIKNCKAQLNWASTLISQSKNSAGFYLDACNYCILKNCTALHNKGGNYAVGTAGSDTINITTSCGGFGLINQGSSLEAPNIGNQCIDCVFDGNGTQFSNTDPGNNHKAYSGGRRYWPSQAIDAGAIEYCSRQSLYKNCCFNNNGLSNYVYSAGLIITAGSINILVDECTATNNRFYGYSDLNTNCETYFLQSITLGNGSYNPVAIAVTSSQTNRNVQITYGSKNPFYTINMDDYSSITASNSIMHNYNIIGRKP